VGSILVNHAVLENGLTQEIAVVKIVLTLLDAKHALQQALVALVRLDMKVMVLEDVEYARMGHTLLLVVSVFLVLAANGQLLEVIPAQIV